MTIFIHNSLTKKKEEFRPLNPPRVKMYTCGVTVYDECHIGHARSLYIFEVIRRYLKYRGFQLQFVRNITDIDDKIINRAQELKVPWDQLAQGYIAKYYADLALLGVEKGDLEPRATENISEMIRDIAVLIERGFAYETPSGVYFSVRKFPQYGKLSGQGIDQMLAGVRIEPEEEKRDPLDFALWKRAKEDEPFWESPWGKGRPGWHIECSVMSLKYLDTETLDIHAGGRDLIFPHHENEIAQSEAANAKPFANYWMHHGLLTINGQKMAKSSGNFITISDFIKKYKDADLLKLFFLSTHYAHPIDYNEEKIKEARKQKKNFNEFIDKVNNWQKTKPASSQKDKIKIDKICEKFEQAMDDDFNTPLALASLFELRDLGLDFISCDKEEAFIYAKSKLEIYFSIFGIKVKPKESYCVEIAQRIQERIEDRKNKDFQKADAIREKLEKEYKIIVSDTANSATFTEI